MGLFVYFAVPLICTLLFRHFIRQPTGSLFLEGLYTFLPQASAIANPPPGPKATKRDRKLLQKRQLQLQGAQCSLIMQQLSPSALSHLSSEPSTFGSSFETLGILLLVLFVGVVVHFILGPLLGLWQEVLLYTLGPLVVMWAPAQLVTLECNGSLKRLLGDRFQVVVLAAVGGAAAYGILLAAPPGWIRWNIQSASKDLDELYMGSITRLLAVRMRRYHPPPPLDSDPCWVAAGLAAVAGVVAATLLGPASRVAKLYHYTSPVPSWAAKYLTPHPLATAIIRLSLVLPLLVVLYGIIPMSDFWPVPSAVAGALGPALVAATAVVQLLAVRPLVAAHLGGGLLEWHLLRHEALPGGGGGSTGAQTVRDTLIRKRLTLVYATVCQVGLQLLAPAAIMVCLALLYGGASGALDTFRPPQPLIANLGARPSVLQRVDALAAAAAAPPPIPQPPPPVTAAAAAAASAGGGDFLDGLDGMTSSEEVAAAAAVAAATAAGTPGGRNVSGGEGGGGDGLPPLPPLTFVSFAASFLAWWACVVTCLFTYPLLFVYRTGLHVG
ncbi:hypothetical protein VaNZ11_016650 [Volvox africanus]|uniref:Uncharacterized protein n=1 Tax=Volvox africanus TaxID=51714 RepID=A0ABQ5SQR2_9CHLO|nr:hypothetical protein VaNZ11_016650 [Volvox africanus]